MHRTFDTDDDTRRLFDIVGWCLERYFGHTDESATAAINAYYHRFSSLHDDDVYHELGPYFSALRIHYVIDLGGTLNRFPLWRHEAGYLREPPESLEYFRENYFRK